MNNSAAYINSSRLIDRLVGADRAVANNAKKNYYNSSSMNTNNPKSLTKPQEALISALQEGKRNPELEQIILQDAQCCVDYARFIIKGRWPEAEDVIAKAEPHVKVLGGRGGPTKSLFYVYAHLIKDRFLKAEERLVNYRSWWGALYAYSKLILKTKNELVDFGKPGIVVWLLYDISSGKFGKKMSKEKRYELVDQLKRRISLYSFSHPDDSSLKKYIRDQKKIKKTMVFELEQFDKDMTVAQIIEKIR